MSVVLLHGFTQTGASWAPLLPHLATTSLIAPDLPGHGSAGQVRTDLAATADQLVDEFANPILVGYSMGGRLALHAAIRQPARVRGLVLIGATPGIADVDEREARRRSDAQLADHVEDIGVEAFLSEWLAQPLFATLPAASRTLVDRRTNTADGLAWSLRTWSTGAQQSQWESLSLITCPVLLVTGSLDTKFTEIARRMQHAIGRNCRHVVIDGAGHSAHLEQPAEVTRVINEFVRLIDG